MIFFLQEDFPVNDPEINQAATKIQAKFRGHKARQNVEKLKQEVCLQILSINLSTEFIFRLDTQESKI